MGVLGVIFHQRHVTDRIRRQDRRRTLTNFAPGHARSVSSPPHAAPCYVAGSTAAKTGDEQRKNRDHGLLEAGEPQGLGNLFAMHGIPELAGKDLNLEERPAPLYTRGLGSRLGTAP